MTPTPSAVRLSAQMRRPPKATISDFIALAVVGLIIAYGIWKILAG